MKNFINIHVLQSVAPSNLNRDETGRPKTATYGGVLRHRVSSQSWKRAMRMYFKQNSIETAYRTKNIADLVAHSIVEKDKNLSFEEAKEKAISALRALEWIKKTKKDDQTDALSMVSPAQIALVAETILMNIDDDKELKKRLKASLVDGENAIDLALFGRMVASDPNLNIEGCTLVSHAISTHGIEEEFDFYTATDDFLDVDDSGAGMIGDIEFTSSTLYRYASLNVSALQRNLGNVDTNVLSKAIQDFVKSFIYSMPSGKQNSFATPTLPSLIIVSFGDTPVSYASGFEKPVVSSNGYIEESINNLLSYVIELEENYGLDEERFSVIVNHDNNRLEEISTIGNIKDLESKLVITSDEKVE